MGLIYFFPNCILKIRVHLLKTNKFLYWFFFFFFFTRGFNQRFVEKCKQFKHFGSDLYRTLLFLTWTLALSSQRGTHMAGEKSVALDQVLSFQWIGQSFQMFLNLYSSNKFNVTWYFWELLQVLISILFLFICSHRWWCDHGLTVTKPHAQFSVLTSISGAPLTMFHTGVSNSTPKQISSPLAFILTEISILFVRE